MPIAIGYTRHFNPVLAVNPAAGLATGVGAAYGASAGDGGWPTPTTVGVPSGAELTDWTGDTEIGPGTYEGIRFPLRMGISAAATTSSFPTFSFCHFEQGLNNFASGGGRRFYVADCTFGMDDSCWPDFVLGCQDFDAVRCAVYGSDGVRWSQHNWDEGHRYSLTDCFIRSCAVFPAHGDGLQADGSDGPLDLFHCTVDMRGTNSTACVFWGDFATIPDGHDGAILDGCLFVGEEYFGTKMSQGVRHQIRDCVYVGWDVGGENDAAFNANISVFENNRVGTITGDYEVTVGDLLAA